MKKKDILNRQDIESVVNHFYDKVRKDDILSRMFDHVDWEKHLPVMYDFWDNVLFYTGKYTGNPMAKHLMAHGRNPMTSTHFERWLKLFYEVLDESYVGKNTTLLKERANSIAKIMQIKLFGNELVLK
ncbi:MAG: group III truncated hemoglobin [Saprospiraceae bacterium]|nr:group III truncated hemoglobin [Saprospiraceae bacterium]